MGETCELGSQLGPHVVWFGEDVPMMKKAIPLYQQADIFVVIGTSLSVYPAAGLLDFAPKHIPKILIDPHPLTIELYPNAQQILDKASTGVQKWIDSLSQYANFTSKNIFQPK